MDVRRKQLLVGALADALSSWNAEVESGPYLGAENADATLRTSDDIDGADFEFDQSDAGYRFFGGYLFLGNGEAT